MYVKSPDISLRLWLLGVSAQTDFSSAEASQFFLHKETFNCIHCETKEEEEEKE
jgi:hypothetical protein